MPASVTKPSSPAKPIVEAFRMLRDDGFLNAKEIRLLRKEVSALRQKVERFEEHLKVQHTV